jgi:hypothetical protein
MQMVINGTNPGFWFALHAEAFLEGTILQDILGLMIPEAHSTPYIQNGHSLTSHLFVVSLLLPISSVQPRLAAGINKIICYRLIFIWKYLRKAIQ